MDDDVESLIAYCRANGRVFPVRWDVLYRLLPNRRRDGNGWVPALPLILGGIQASDELKQERLAEHIRWAADHDSLPVVDMFLRGLPETGWMYLNGRRRPI